MSNKEAKQKYWKKTYENAPLVECACGCGVLIKSKDNYGRDKRYVNGHNNRKYETPTQYKIEWCHRNREQRQSYKTIYGRKRKEKLIEFKGGKCSICGVEYDGENTAIFDFHHKNPKEKSFVLSTSNLIRYNWNKIVSEVEKCELLCSNCHRLKHFWEDINTAGSDDVL